jgi:hypothetical protein
MHFASDGASGNSAEIKMPCESEVGRSGALASAGGVGRAFGTGRLKPNALKD